MAAAKFKILKARPELLLAADINVKKHQGQGNEMHIFLYESERNVRARKIQATRFAKLGQIAFLSPSEIEKVTGGIKLNG